MRRSSVRVSLHFPYRRRSLASSSNASNVILHHDWPRLASRPCHSAAALPTDTSSCGPSQFSLCDGLYTYAVPLLYCCYFPTLAGHCPRPASNVLFCAFGSGLFSCEQVLDDRASARQSPGRGLHLRSNRVEAAMSCRLQPALNESCQCASIRLGCILSRFREWFSSPRGIIAPSHWKASCRSGAHPCGWLRQCSFGSGVRNAVQPSSCLSGRAHGRRP